MSSAVISRAVLPWLARFCKAARLEPPSCAQVFGTDPEAMRGGWAPVAEPIHDRPSESLNAIAELIGAN